VLPTHQRAQRPLRRAEPEFEFNATRRIAPVARQQKSLKRLCCQTPLSVSARGGWAWASRWLKLASHTPVRNAPDLSVAPGPGNHQKGNPMDKPVIKQDPLYQLLRTEDIKGFNEQRDRLDTSELKNGDYRGRDFRNTNLEGASLLDAKLSGTYFPAALSAQEIRLSLDTGTRLRYSKE